MIDKNQAIKNGITIIDSTKATNALFDILQAQFPQTIKDGQVSLNAIANLLGLQSSNMQGYELTFTGKGLANALYSTPCQKQLKLQESFTPQTSPNKHPKNAIIVGDNLDALKLLKAAYSEKIKMIYIDPPYNTTNENFIYPDNFRQDYKKILEEVGLIEIDENGQEVESEDLKFFKNIQGSRTHSGWLSFMLPRLKLARDLLKEDGVIFISIDDNEQANLKLLCDEIFGEDNFVSCFVWQKKSGGGQAKYFYEGHEYVLIYCKNKDLLQGLFKIKEKGKIETDFLRKIHGKYTNNLKLKNVYEKYPNQLIEHRNLMFEEMDIFLQEKLITQEKYDEIKQNLTNGIYFLKPYNDKFNLVCRNNENNQALMYSIISGVWTSDGNTENEQLFGKLVFNDPKPVNLLKQLIQSATMQGNSNDIILDFFAGSGTTAQAVMELNAEDKGNREFILVQIDEEIKEDKSKSAYDFCKKELKSENPVISDITAERVRRVSAKIATKLTKENIDLGFKLYRLESKPKLMSNEKGALRLMTNADLSALDKALNLALQSGKTLDKPLKVVIENKLYKCEDSYFCVECDKSVLESLSQTSDEYIYIDAYSDINLEHFLNLDARFKERLNVVY